jgi:hypothetical protein
MKEQELRFRDGTQVPDPKIVTFMLMIPSHKKPISLVQAVPALQRLALSLGRRIHRKK